jgi:hypothetical protein
MWEWEAQQGRMHAGIYLCPLRGVSRSWFVQAPFGLRHCFLDSPRRLATKESLYFLEFGGGAPYGLG